MIQNKKVLAIIPARGGSKGIPGKNLINFGGKPLIAWTIEAAKKSKYIDRIILSSDDELIIQQSLRYGCEVPFKRPQELATDQSPTKDTILHALELVQEGEIIVLLQPTSPLRIAEDIDACIDQHMAMQASIVSISETEKPLDWNFYLEESGHLQPVLDLETRPTRRQDTKKAFFINGAVYVFGRIKFMLDPSIITKETHGYIMPAERAVDIDSKLDLLYAEAILSYQLLNKK